ncbi:kinase-like protein [Pyrenochaeta sp. DS3sAY3a]|nr:kinase-like protein [Pyrenochaeta sp. DS3sAY3a]
MSIIVATFSSPTRGASGRLYYHERVLKERFGPREVFVCDSNGERFILKRVPRNHYDRAVALAKDLEGSKWLRLHVDFEKTCCVLIYPFYRDTFHDIMRAQEYQKPLFHLVERKKVMWAVGQAIQELHAKDWLHNDIKPENILVQWQLTPSGRTVTDVKLGDFDVVYNLAGEPSFQNATAVGTVEWISPEAQFGRLSKASDMFSFGLVVSTAPMLVLNGPQPPARFPNLLPDQEAMIIRHFSCFGPLPEGNHDFIGYTWALTFMRLSVHANANVRRHPDWRLNKWIHRFGAGSETLIQGMTNLIPKNRLDIGTVLASPWWTETYVVPHT